MPHASQAHAQYRAVTRFKNLDGVRFIAIAMVLWHHAQPLTSVRLLDRGFLGVDFFFVLSGFLITTLLLREAALRGRFSLPAFYMRRALRIIPVYFFVVSGVGAYYVLLRGDSALAGLLPYYYLFLSNFLTSDIPTLSITWSLSMEEQYYLIWPALLALLPRRWVLPVLAALIGLNALFAIGVLGHDPARFGPLAFALPRATFAPILMGSALAVLLHRKRWFDRLYPSLGHPASPLLGFAGLILAMAATPENLTGWPTLLIQLVMTLTLASLVVRQDTLVTPALAFAPVARIGVVSYGIYLYHLIALDPVMRLAGRLDWANGWLVLLAYSALSWATAEVSFRTLEAWARGLRPKG